MLRSVHEKHSFVYPVLHSHINKTTRPLQSSSTNLCCFHCYRSFSLFIHHSWMLSS